MVTRESCRLLVLDSPWEFAFEEGRVVLITSIGYRNSHEYRLAFIRAGEAMNAVRAGHHEAMERRQKAKTTRGDLKQGRLL